MITTKSFAPVTTIVTSFSDLMNMVSSEKDWPQIETILKNEFVHSVNGMNGIEYLEHVYNEQLSANLCDAEYTYNTDVSKWEKNKKVESLIKIPKKWKSELTVELIENDTNKIRQMTAGGPFERLVGWQNRKCWMNDKAMAIVGDWTNNVFGYSSKNCLKDVVMFSIDFVSPETRVLLKGFGHTLDAVFVTGSKKETVYFRYDNLPYSYRCRHTKGSGTSSIDYIRKHMIGAAEMLATEIESQNRIKRKMRRMSDIVCEKLGGTIDWRNSSTPGGRDPISREYIFCLEGMDHISFTFRFDSVFGNQPELDHQIGGNICVYSIDSSALKKMDIGMALVLFGQLGDK